MTSVRKSISGLLAAANPAFATAIIGTVITVGLYGFVTSSVFRVRYLHLVLGLLWTGCNLLLGLVIGPTLSELDDRRAAAVYGRTAPRLTLLLPALLILVIGIGLPLAVQMHLFPHAGPWLALFMFLNLTGVLLVFGWRFDAWQDWRWITPVTLVTLASVGLFVATLSQFGMTLRSMLLTLIVGSMILINGLGLILSGNLKASLEARTQDPNTGLIAAIGRQNTALARLQILLQITIILSVL